MTLTMAERLEAAVEKILTEEICHVEDSGARAIPNQDFQKVTLTMIEEVCSSLAVGCISASDRPLFNSVSKSELVGKVDFLNRCLVRRTRFIHACREQAWKKFYARYVEEMGLLATFLGSPRAPAWLCLRLFEQLLNANYPLSPTRDDTLRQSSQLSQQVKDILNYIAGSIVKKLIQRTSALKPSTQKDDILQLLGMMQGKESDDNTHTLTSALDRGGLTYVTAAAQKFFNMLEIQMQKVVMSDNMITTCKVTKFENICSSDETTTSSFNDMFSSLGEPGEANDMLFAHITHLFFKIRVHHECRMFMERWKTHNSVQKKGLRKGLKPSAV